MNYVIGSGPAGVSCAKGLLSKGAQVTMIDVGLQLEPERKARLTTIKQLQPEQWSPEDVAFMKEGLTATAAGIPLKRAYGSEYPYRHPGVNWRVSIDGVHTNPSFAQGGLSTVWGSSILPFRSSDIKDWPIAEADLADHYRAVHDFLPLATAVNSLERLYPLYAERTQHLNPSSQAATFLSDLAASREKLESRGIFFGASRLAVWAEHGPAATGCNYCTSCMYGCPYELIYNSSATLDVLRAHPDFNYRENIAVDRIEESSAGVTLHSHDLRSGIALDLKGSRVYLACGVLPTTKILLHSLEAFDREVVLRDSFYFLLPLIRFRRSDGASRERLHTLAQVFLEILDSAICDKTIHLQVYTYNDLYSTALKGMFGPLYPLVKMPEAMLLERLMMIQGYLPSDYSPGIRAVLRKNGSSGETKLDLTSVHCDKTAPSIQKIARKLSNSASLLGARPLTPLLRPGKPGRGYHTGGSFPMRSRPEQLESDLWGRPYGFQRVHAVDASVFPSIPASTITLSVMANAHRIGAGIGEY